MGLLNDGTSAYQNALKVSPPPSSPLPTPQTGGFFSTAPGHVLQSVLGGLNKLDLGLKKAVIYPFNPDFARLVGQKDISGALESRGYIKPANNFLGKARNFALDAAIDPVNLLSFGVGSGAEIANVAGKATRLTSVGTEALNAARDAQLAGRAVTPEILSAASRNAEKTIAGKIATQAPEAARFVDKGGVKLNIPFTNKQYTILPGEFTTGPLGKLGTTVADKTGLTRLFTSNVDQIKNLNVQRAAQLAVDTHTANVGRFGEDLSKVSKGVSAAEANHIPFAIAEGSTGSLTGQAKELANFASSYFSKAGKDLEKRGLIKGMLDEYVPIILKNPAQREGLMGYLRQSGFRFGKPREVFKNILDAKAAGYDVETDIRKVLEAYNFAYSRAVTHDDLFKTISKEGVPRTVLQGTQEPTQNAKISFGPQQPATVTGKSESLLSPRPVPPIPGGAMPNPELVPTTRITFAGKEPKPVVGNVATTASDKFATSTLEHVPNTQTISASGEPLVPVSGVRGLENVLVDPSTKSYLDRLLAVSAKPQEVAGALKTWDRVQGLYKTALTTLFPSFHARNFLSNVEQNYLDIGLLSSLNPKWKLNAVQVMTSRDPEKILEIGGVKMKVADWKRLAENQGILQSASPTFDIVGKINPANYGARVGRSIENEARMTNFLANIERTGSVATATAQTKKFLFDYGNLSDFEKGFMRRIFLFYTWPKKNLLLQMERLVKTPEKFVKIAIAQREADSLRSGQENSLLPGYLKQDINFPMGKDAQGNLKTLAGFQTPLGQASQMLDNPLGTALNSLNPLIKIPAGIGTNQNFFNGKKISEDNNATQLAILNKLPQGVQDLVGFKTQQVKDDKGNVSTKYYANPKAIYALTNILPTSRFTNVASQLANDNTDTTSKALKFLVNAGITKTDLQVEASKGLSAYEKQLAQPLINQGYLLQSGSTFYVPKDLVLDPATTANLKTVTSVLNNKSTVASAYLQSVGANPADFAGLFPATQPKALTAKQMAAVMAFSSSPDKTSGLKLAADTLLPARAQKAAASGTRVGSSGGRRSPRVSIGRAPSGRLGRGKTVRVPKISFSTPAKVKSPKLKGLKFKV